MINCIYCSSSNCALNGHDKKGVQRYKCNACKKRFCEKGIFARFRTDKQFIFNCLFLRSHTLSLREVKRISRKFFGIKRSHVSIYNWIMKFEPKLAQIEKSMPLKFTDIWHVDEKFIHVRGSKDKHAYLYVVADSKNNVLATLVANSRSEKNAEIVLRKAKERAGFAPAYIITDGCHIYDQSCRIFGRKTRHFIDRKNKKRFFHYGKIIKLSNNRIERINSFYSLWLHVCRGLKSFETANVWIEFFTLNYNYLKKTGIKEESKIEWEEIPEMINGENIFAKQKYHLLS